MGTHTTLSPDPATRGPIVTDAEADATLIEHGWTRERLDRLLSWQLHILRHAVRRTHFRYHPWERP